METVMQRLRNRRGMTQADMARKAGVSESAYQLYEYNKRTPKADVAAKLAKALGTTVETLWGESGAK